MKLQFKDKKVVFVDVDNTLVGKKDKYKISLENKLAIKNLQKQKVHFVLITGRSQFDTKMIWKQIFLNTYGNYAVYSNGAVVENFNENKIISNHPIDVERVEEIVTYCLKNKFYFKLSNDKNLWRTKRGTFSEFVFKNFFHVPIKSFKTLSDLNYQNVHKIGIFYSIDKKKNYKLIKTLKIKFPELEYITSTRDLFIEITASGVNKAHGAKIVLDKLGIKPEQAIAIGDSMNDYRLFQYVGSSVVVKNGSKKLKSIANYQTKTAKKNGVAYTIDKIV